MIVDNDLLSMQNARIIAENALLGQNKLLRFSQEKLDEIVKSIVKSLQKHLKELAIMSTEETGYGRWQDKLIKNSFSSKYLYKYIRDMRCVGVINKDNHDNITEVGIPMGVIAAICPATSPVSTTIYKTLIAIKSGNSIIFSPHPRAVKSISRVLDIIINTAVSSGTPDGCISYLNPVTKSGTLDLINHKAISLIMITAVPSLLQAVRSSGKPFIYGSSGNCPVFIERTANIRQAAKDIIYSKRFDNGIAPSTEQSVVVDACIANDVRNALSNNGAYFMNEDETSKLSDIICKNGKINVNMIGMSANKLAKMAGIYIHNNVHVLIAERKYFLKSDTYVKDILCPVLSFYIEKDWMDACEKCLELLLAEDNTHTLIIHSNNKEVIDQFAIKKPVTRLLVNTPGVFGGIGATTSLFPAMTIGCGYSGNGITSENVSPRNLTYIRKIGYGSSKVKLKYNNLNVDFNSCIQNKYANNSNMHTLINMQKIIREVVRNLNNYSNE